MELLTFDEILIALTDRQLERLRLTVVAEQSRRTKEGSFHFSTNEPDFERPALWGIAAAPAEKPSDR